MDMIYIVTPNITYHPDFNIPNNSTVQPDFEESHSSSIVSTFLSTPDLPHVTASKPPKGPRVLTSVENVKMLMEKEQSKRELEEMKRLRKEERLKKAEERRYVGPRHLQFSMYLNLK